MNKRGFTLIELIIVIIVIGILAMVAIPQYLRATERARIGKGINALGLISKAEKMYRAQNDTYIAANNSALNDAAGLGGFVELGPVVVDPDFDYAVTGTVSTFTAVATRTGGSYNGKLINMTDDGNLSQYGL